ncbi:hypothetical protein HOR43_gp50 [Streptomyces phage Ididsumtinwong]|uniref:Uncharacterized protein n=2 Tax=Austintatiousvirus ididsumtinwong TaxID=2734220 RepID=A0A1J0MBW1_9CAUD|nr:hypothetical protein HOR43_gp50 [Streptomyces phage Ididsumtinwong]APD18507.1 hypothetical protein SEA_IDIDSUMTINWONG_32 [Streptomyces phage Ididsumtinwong]APD18726.1 hypothetical protein SEA_BIOSCUM_32 [Streptomyces phage Bioscum]
MFRRPAPLITAGLFAAALAVGASGWATGAQALTDAGILGAVATVPLLYWVMITRTHQITDDQLAEAHQAGYALALHHVARGLLVPDPAPPTPGHHQDDEQTPGNVVQLHRSPTNTPKEKRKAQ